MGLPPIFLQENFRRKCNFLLLIKYFLKIPEKLVRVEDQPIIFLNIFRVYSVRTQILSQIGAHLRFFIFIVKCYPITSFRSFGLPRFLTKNDIFIIGRSQVVDADSCLGHVVSRKLVFHCHTVFGYQVLSLDGKFHFVDFSLLEITLFR